MVYNTAFVMSGGGEFYPAIRGAGSRGLDAEIAPGIYAYEDHGELDPLGRTMWLRVAFGRGWGIHALACVGVAPNCPIGVVLSNDGVAYDVAGQNCGSRVNEFHTITPGDRVVRVKGHGLIHGVRYLCFNIELHLASGRVLSSVGEHRPWCGLSFDYACPPGHAVMSIRFSGGTVQGLNVMKTSLFEPWSPRGHRFLAWPPAARAIKMSCRVALTNGVPAAVWCHVLSFLRGYDFLEPVLCRTFGLPEHFRGRINMAALLQAGQPVADY